MIPAESPLTRGDSLEARRPNEGPEMLTPHQAAQAAIRAVMAVNGPGSPRPTERRRSKEVVSLRHAAIWVAAQLAPHASLPELAKAFGGLHHTSVLYALRRIGSRANLLPPRWPPMPSSWRAMQPSWRGRNRVSQSRGRPPAPSKPLCGHSYTPVGKSKSARENSCRTMIRNQKARRRRPGSQKRQGMAIRPARSQNRLRTRHGRHPPPSSRQTSQSAAGNAAA